ncbi:MAG TPA: transposase [Spirochaetota bacterium]|nr:transposase [Spirochaetota bacterium]
MSNAPRICKPNLTYHLVSRCIECRNVMREASIKELLMKVLCMAQEKYSFEIVHYTIMDTHFHFIFRSVDGGETVSRIMQFIKSQLARRYNKKMNRTGPFWNERFSDFIVELSENPVFYFLWLMWYIAYNSVRSGHVRDPRNYAYSAINAYLDRDYVSPVKITLHSYFLKLGETFEERVRHFLYFEELYRKRLYCGI